MATKAKGKRRDDGRVQIVLRASPETKALLQRTAKSLGISMNRAAESRLATGRWPRPLKEAK